MTFVYIGAAAMDLSRLEAASNVRIISKRPYPEIPHYGKCFDVAIMPWVQNDWINACNPIKLKEYLALGKPVVSTPFAELANYGDLVTAAADAEAFADGLREALAGDSGVLKAARRERVKAHSWAAKAAEAARVIREARRG
jgi:glycosyltransferase involved in cell wall biosynthesis